MAFSESRKNATIKYLKKLHRILIDVKEEYNRMKAFADANGLSVRALILKAVNEKIERDSL